VGSALAVCMYGSPASTIVQVIRQKSAASIHLPFVLTSALNSLLWATYGLIVNEPFLWAPIGLGLVFNVILLVLKAVFHKRDKGDTVRVPAGDVADDSSSSSCVPRLHVPLLRRLTKNASVVPYAASSAWERAPNSGSPCVPQPLVPQLRMEAVVEPGQMASFKHPPVQEPLLISRNDCPICLEPMGGASDGTSDGRQCIELSCAHMLCSPCATKCSKQGHASCPVCRHPHLLDPADLHSRNTAWRIEYGRWRKGKMRGSVGEICDITTVTGPAGAGAGTTLHGVMLQSEQIRALDLASPIRRVEAHTQVDVEKSWFLLEKGMQLC